MWRGGLLLPTAAVDGSWWGLATDDPVPEIDELDRGNGPLGKPFEL